MELTTSNRLLVHHVDSDVVPLKDHQLPLRTTEVIPISITVRHITDKWTVVPKPTSDTAPNPGHGGWPAPGGGVHTYPAGGPPTAPLARNRDGSYPGSRAGSPSVGSSPGSYNGTYGG